jgi:hypothetical protein
MHAASYLAAGLIAFLPVAANAACQPSFGSGPNLVQLAQAASLDGPEVTDRFQVEIRNDGSDVCTLRLVVERDVAASDASFPTYSLYGPNGAIPAELLARGAGAASSGAAITVTVPANGRMRIPYDVRLALGWGAKAGTYGQELVYSLYPVESQELIATQRTRLNLEVPAVARVRFSGASGVEGPARLEMGPLSATARTVSPPFAVRVLSTSAYRVELSSQNRGALRRIGGPELIPYRLSLGGQIMNLGSGGASIGVGNHTSATGDVHPVAIVIDPDPTRHAGNYSDNVTVSITTL